MKLFSHRKGLKPVRDIIQKDLVDDRLKTALWNVTYLQVMQHTDTSIVLAGESLMFFRSIWIEYLGLPVDDMTTSGDKIVNYLKPLYFNFAWNEVFDFIETLVNLYPRKVYRPVLTKAYNTVLEKELSACRFVEGQIVEITSAEEIASLETAIYKSPNPVQSHLRQALEHFADRENPDYRNSIKESFSAVEAICKQIAGEPKATLGDALKEIESKKQVDLHPALKIPSTVFMAIRMTHMEFAMRCSMNQV